VYDFERYFRIRVERVKDGDTIVASFYLGLGIWLNDQPVRLLGINAPEMKGETREQGEAVKVFLEKLLKEADDVILRTDEEKKGKYGRFLCTVLARVGDKWHNVNELLLKRGAAKEYMAAEETTELKEIFDTPAPNLEERIVVDEPRTEVEVYNGNNDKLQTDEEAVAELVKAAQEILDGDQRSKATTAEESEA
jgi:micrococcal nuclease